MPRRRNKNKTPASSILGTDKIAEIIEGMKERGELPRKVLSDEQYSTPMMRLPAICWGIPFDEVVFSKWVKHLISHLRPMPWDDTIVTGSTYLPEARNLIHSQYLKESTCDYLFMLDSDVIPPPGVVEKLLSHMQKDENVRIVGGWYRIKQEPYNPVVYYDEGDDEDGIMMFRKYGNNEVGKGLAKVEGAGAGCWMMHRSVAESIGEKPYDMSKGGEDLLLCRKVRAAGFDLYIDWDLACAHAGVAVA